MTSKMNWKNNKMLAFVNEMLISSWHQQHAGLYHGMPKNELTGCMLIGKAVQISDSAGRRPEGAELQMEFISTHLGFIMQGERG